VRFDVTRHPTAAWLSQQVIEAFPWETAPSFLLRDRDASYGAVFSKRVATMGITEVVTAPRSPWQNAYIERVISSIRRERLDHVVIFKRASFALRPFILRGLLPPSPNASRTRQGLSAIAPHPATAERPSHRHTASRRVTPSLPAPRGLTVPTTACHCLRGGRYRTVRESSH
jgi:hypothetical protein